MVKASLQEHFSMPNKFEPGSHRNVIVAYMGNGAITTKKGE